MFGYRYYTLHLGFSKWPHLGSPSGSHGKESACNAGDPAWVPGLGRSPEEGNGYPLQYSCLENSMNLEKIGRL